MKMCHFIASFSLKIKCVKIKSMQEKVFLLYFSMNYRDFSVKSKLIISLFQTVKLSFSISLFKKRIFVKYFHLVVD